MKARQSSQKRDTAELAARSWWRWRRLGRRTDRIWRRLLDSAPLWILLFVLVGLWLSTPREALFVPRVDPGSIAGRDYVAPRDLLVPDEETTLEKRQRAREEVLAVYDFDAGAVEERVRDLGRLFEAGRRIAAGGSAEAAVLEELADTTSLRIQAEQLRLLADRRFSADLEDRLEGALTRVLRRGVVANKPLLLEDRARGIRVRNLEDGSERQRLDLYDYLDHPEEVREFLESELRGWMGLAPRDRERLLGFLVANVQPNLHLNRSETLKRRDEAAAAVAPAFKQVRRGQVIVRQGDEIDRAASRAIAEIHGQQALSSRLLPILGSFLLFGLAGWALWFGLRQEEERSLDEPLRKGNLVGEVTLLLILGLIGLKVGGVVAEALADAFEAGPLGSIESYLLALPFASLALLVRLFYGRNAGLLAALVFSLAAPRVLGAEEGLWVVLYTLVGSLAAIFAIERDAVKARWMITRAGLIVGGVNVVAVLMLMAMAADAPIGLSQVGFDLVCALVSGLLVAAVASFALPILEPLLSVTTDIKLVELANTNLPLLRRLAYQAPGTFQHSMMVAHLAKAGCQAIGADAALAYTGGLYHDIGKMHRPEYFVENQRQGLNRHDKLLPSMSALILISHVKDGLEMAREHHLPLPILDAIAQHHGTSLIKFFHSRELERVGGRAEEVREEKFRYPGPKPQNRVMGVLMLADAVEAASRTLIEATPGRLRAMIRTIVDNYLQDGQLNEARLTLGDIDAVSEAFVDVLANLFHRRVDYPGFEFNVDRAREAGNASAMGAS